MLSVNIEGRDLQSIIKFIQTGNLKFNVKYVKKDNTIKWKTPECYKIIYLYKETPFGYFYSVYDYKDYYDDAENVIIFIFEISGADFYNFEIDKIKTAICARMKAMKIKDD